MLRLWLSERTGRENHHAKNNPNVVIFFCPRRGAERRFFCSSRHLCRVESAVPLQVRQQSARQPSAQTSGRARRLDVSEWRPTAISIFGFSQAINWGGDNGMLSQLRAGALDFFYPILTGHRPAGVGRSDQRRGVCLCRLQDRLGGDGRNAGAFIAAEVEKSGLHMMRTVWDNGFRQLTTSVHPVAARRPICAT